MSQIPFLPAPLRPRKDGWSPARQWAFLQQLEATASVTEAARRVGMTPESAWRLRRHPEAEGFRRAWAAVQGRIWQRVEQVALERVVNGDLEVIERDGAVVATRRRPCSDRLMIHMLKAQLARAEAEVAALAAANAAAAQAAEAARRAPWPLVDGVRVPPAAETEDAFEAETRALRDLHAISTTLPDSTGWDGEAEDLSGAAPVLPMPERTLTPANGRIVPRWRAARLRRPGAEPAAPRSPRKPPATPNRKVMDSPPGHDFSRPGPDEGWGTPGTERLAEEAPCPAHPAADAPPTAADRLYQRWRAAHDAWDGEGDPPPGAASAARIRPL